MFKDASGFFAVMRSTVKGARSPRRVRAWRWAVAGVVALASAAGLGRWAYVRFAERTAEAAVAVAYRGGRAEAAREALGRWLKRSPNSAAPYLWKVRFALAGRRLDEAEDAMRRAEALGAPRLEIVRLNAVAGAFTGRFTESEPILRQAFNENAGADPLVDEALARVYLETYDFHRAGIALKRWMDAAPHDPKPYLWRAEIDTRTSDTGAALADYREALKRDPRSARARFGLAEGLRQGHFNAEAAEAYAAYLELRPDDPAAHLGAGRNAAELGNAEDALRHLERASELAPNDAEVHRVLADLLTRRNDFKAALAHLDRAVALDPYDLEARHSRGLVLTRLGRLDEAKADQARATKLRAEMGDLLSAQTKLVRSPHDCSAKLRIMRWMFNHGKTDEGVRWAETILREQPNQSDACRSLAEHYARTGQTGRANFYRALAGPEPAAPGQKTRKP
jgi:tetratricopeptide (TPR) repeat protein